MVFITNQSVNTEILRQQKLAVDIANYQQQISTGKKFTQPSDNPQDWIQISLVGRQQSLTNAWKDNLTFAQSRATQASSSLTDVNNLMTEVTEQLIIAKGQEPNSPGAEAVALQLEGIKATITSILKQTDYQGTPTFDDKAAITIPIAQGLSVEAVGTRQSIEEGIPTANGPKTIYEVLDAAIAAVRTGVGISDSLTDARTSLDHVIVEQSRQGVRSQRLDQEVQRIQSANLQLTERRSGLEDTDLTEVIARVQAKLVSLQAAQAAFAKINQQSLFSLLR
jgi:flagellar hook-associated protein 3 FlgL